MYFTPIYYKWQHMRRWLNAFKFWSPVISLISIILYVSYFAMKVAA